MRLDAELYAEADRYKATGTGQEDIAQLLDRAAARIRELEAEVSARNKATFREDADRLVAYENRIRELEAATSLAYGWLWHVISDDKHIHAARAELLSAMNKTNQSNGIQAAKDAGAKVTRGQNYE